jgi:hypothetical protein
VFDGLELEITHRCNKHCRWCDHRIMHSDFDVISRDDYEYIVSCIDSPERERFRHVRLIGGEPLCHPDFAWLVRRVKIDFPAAMIQVDTNGGLLSRLPSSLLRDIDTVRLTEYPGWNDSVLRKFGPLPNVVIAPSRDFWNPYQDPDILESEARTARNECLRRFPYLSYPPRVVGLKMYGCCSAESIERYYGLPPVHAVFDRDWKERLQELPTWLACQHCFRVEKDGLLWGSGDEHGRQTVQSSAVLSGRSERGGQGTASENGE